MSNPEAIHHVRNQIDDHIRYLRALYERMDLDRHPQIISEDRARHGGAVDALQNLREDLFGSKLEVSRE